VKQSLHDFKHPPRERFLSRLNRVLIALTIAAGSIPFSNYVTPSLNEKAEQDKLLAEMTLQLEEAQMVNARLAREVLALNNDPEYLSLFARDGVREGYMQPGETIFRLSPKRQ
jgi:cell division protein FtsB